MPKYCTKCNRGTYKVIPFWDNTDIKYICCTCNWDEGDCVCEPLEVKE